jgi:hypothetical protein
MSINPRNFARTCINWFEITSAPKVSAKYTVLQSYLIAYIDESGKEHTAFDFVCTLANERASTAAEAQQIIAAAHELLSA